MLLSDINQFNSSGSSGGTVDDSVYGPSWNGATSVAPSKNSVFDKIESLITFLPESGVAIININGTNRYFLTSSTNPLP